VFVCLFVFIQDHGVKRIVRVMPSLPCSVQEGASGFVCGSMATREDAALVHKLMSTTGNNLPSYH